MWEYVDTMTHRMGLDLLLAVAVLITLCQGAAPGHPNQNPNPVIVEHPENGYLAKDEPATLNCKAKGTPKPVITWYRNGELVTTYPKDPRSHRMIIQDGQLFFLRVIHTKKEKPDVGVYYCNATNIHGSAVSRNATLRIAILRNEFQESPQDTGVAIGDTATFNCRPPRGEPEPKILWRKGGELIQPDARVEIQDSGALVISQVMASDAGEYKCLATNLAGEKESKPASLRVLEKPSFRKVPVDITTREGKTIEFPCDVIGDQPLDVQWKKEGGYIKFGRMRMLRDHTLRIEKVEAGDAGVYICVAKNGVGTAEAVARLIVQYLPYFVVKPTDKVVGVGRTATLQCVVAGIPPPTIMWSKHARKPSGEKTLMFRNFAEGRYSVASDGTFRIDRVQLTDAGQYECEALSGLGSAKATAVLEVRADLDTDIPENDPRPPPIIRIGPQNQTLPMKDVGFLLCEAVGDPEPAIHWYKNGNLLPIDPRILQLSSGTLQISDLRESDSGTFTCKASSETGETTRSATLNVISPSQTVPFVRTPDVKTFPEAPSKPVVTDVSNTSVQLSWQPNAKHGDSPVFAFIIEYFSYETSEGWLVASDSVQKSPYTIQNLQPDTIYVFLVRAKNSHGTSVPSELSEPVRTKQTAGGGDIRPRFSGIVVELKAVEPLPLAVRVTWKVHKEMALIDRFMIEYTEILDLKTGRLGRKFSKFIGRDQISYIIKKLKSSLWYSICIKAFSGNISTTCSQPFKVQPLSQITTSPPVTRKLAPPSDIVTHKNSDSSIFIRWLPPSDVHSFRHIKAYNIKCISNNEKHNCSQTVPGNITSVTIHDIQPRFTYSIQIAARTNVGTGTWSKAFVFGPEQTSLMKETWFIGLLIGVIGGTLWLALCIFTVWLCRKRKNKKKQKMQEMYSVPNFQKCEESNRNSCGTFYRNGYGHKDLQNCGSSMSPMAPEFANLLESKDVEMQNQNIYNVPHMKTFYNKQDPVAPYATTSLINSGNVPGKSGQGMEHVFRPITQNSGSGDSCKHECSGDSNTDNSRPNTGVPHEHDPMQSPTSDSGSHTTDENGFLLKKGKKPLKQITQPKQAMVNWAEFLPPPPEHPPPPSEMNMSQHSSGNSSTSQQYAEINCLNREVSNRSPMSPMSKISSCSCPVPHNATPMSGWNMPAYSDTGCVRCCSPKYCDTGPYSPNQFNVIQRAQSPRGQDWGNYPRGPDSWGQRTIPCHNVARGTPGEMKCRTCYSDHEQGSLPLLQNYKIMPHPESEHHFVSDSDRGQVPPSSRLCQCGGNYQGYEGHCNIHGQMGQCMDRACQSSLPSVASECIHSSLYHNSGHPMNIAVDGYHRNADSPVSDMGPDYAGESTEAEETGNDTPDADEGQGHSQDSNVSGQDTSPTDQCNTDHSGSSTPSSSDGSFLNEADFASAVARAAEMSGLTVVGTTVTNPTAGKQVRKQRRRSRPRPTSPYSTDSNFSEVVRKPYPKSQRKQQLMDQGKWPKKEGQQNVLPQNYQQRYTPNDDDLPTYNKPNFPIPVGHKPKYQPTKPSNKSYIIKEDGQDSGINEESSRDIHHGIMKV